VEPALDLETLAAGRQLARGHHPRAEAAGAVEILAHVPLRGLALEFAHRAFVAAGIAGDAGIGVADGEVLGPLTDHEDELGLVIERLRHLRANDRLPVWHQRACAAHEDGRKFRNVVALGAFFDVLEIIEPEADDLAGRRHRQAEFQFLERAPRARSRAPGGSLERGEVAVVAAQDGAQIGGDRGPDRLQIDHLLALDDAEVQSAIPLETDDLHGCSRVVPAVLAASMKKANSEWRIANGRATSLLATRYSPRKCPRSRSRPARPDARSKAFTTARRKPPGGMAWRSGSLSSWKVICTLDTPGRRAT